MYYVVQVQTGKEDRTIDAIKKHFSSQLDIDVFSPYRKSIRKYKGGVEKVVIERCFPGYVFVDTSKPKELFFGLYQIPEYTKMLGREALTYNEMHYPKDVRSYLKENQIVPFGEFYLREHWFGNWVKKQIYICSKDWYNTVLAICTGKQFIRMNNMKRVYIPFNKINVQGIPKNGFEIVQVPTGKYVYSKITPDLSWQIYRTEQVPYTEAYNPDFMFFVKGEFSQY